MSEIQLPRSSQDAAALLEEGLRCRTQGRLEEALAAFTRAAQSPPWPLNAFLEAGVTAAMLDKTAAAAGWFRAGIEAWPERNEPYYFEGVLLANQNRHADAVIRFSKAMSLPPPNVDVVRALIFSLRREKRLDEAESFAKAWAETFPDDADAWAALAHILTEAGRLEDALKAARTAKAMAPSSDWSILEARALLLLGRADEAVQELAHARAQDPDNAAVYVHLANALKVTGQIDQARAALTRAVQLDPRDPDIYFSLAEITRFAPGDPILAVMDRLAAEAQHRPGGVPVKLHFALGKALDDIDEVDKAFHHFAEGNAALAGRTSYNESATLAMFERMQALFSTEAIAELSKGGSPSRLPIFIVGLPRSGTTLVEQILASHPDVKAAGEILFLPRAADAALGLSTSTMGATEGLDAAAMAKIATAYLARLQPMAGGKARVTDKLPANAMLAGAIHCALPHARIIHCRRDLMDVGLSCFMTLFGERMPFTTDLAVLGRYLRAHESLMTHWRAVLPPEAMLEVAYEAVVEDLESQARRILLACGLPWDDRCLNFHRTSRPVNTASLAQVREPLYGRSVGRWRRYENFLKPLRQALGTA